MATKTRAEKLAQDCVDNAKAILGSGWGHVSETVQWGLISSEILNVFIHQDEMVSSDRVRTLITDITTAARTIHQG